MKIYNKLIILIINLWKNIKSSIVLIISMFATGFVIALIFCILFLDHADTISEKFDTVAELVMANISFCGAVFGLSIFYRTYGLIIKPAYSSLQLEDYMIVADFINESRLSTSVRFIGIVISAPIQIKCSVNNLFKWSKNEFPSLADNIPKNNNRERYKSYVNVLTNIKAYSSISLSIPLQDIIYFINHNRFWNYAINTMIHQKHRKNIRVLFVFIDYKNKLVTKYFNIDNDYYNKIKKYFEPMKVCNNQVLNDMSLDDALKIINNQV